MKSHIKNMKYLGLVLALVCLQSVATAQQQVRVTIDNLQTNSADGEGFYFTPVFVGFDGGAFNLFDSGQNLADGAALEALAEGGDTSGLSTLFNAGTNTQSATINNPSGLGPGLFNPGSSSSQTFTLASGQTHINFATMLIPTNDAFLGNENTINLFDNGGNFQGLDLTLTLANAWDAGTEVNDRQGAPFSNFGSTTSTSEDIAIALHSQLDRYDSDTVVAGADNFQNGAGSDVSFVSGSDVFRIRVTAVPEPGSALLLLTGAGAVCLARRRRGL